MISCIMLVSLVSMLGYHFLVPLIGLPDHLISSTVIFGPPLCSLSLVTCITWYP
jgi:hypothetical protein